ncbi:MAG: hypothetical protein K8H75_03685, partial [Sulfuricella sp.]|nr:hypothetical protein [Sulfuricella sp.]
MTITGLHVLTSSTDATSTTSYEYFRNEGIKQSENDPLKNLVPGNLGLHADSVGHLAIGYGYDLYARSAATSAATLAPYLVSGTTITARQIAYLEALRTGTALALTGDPLDNKIPTRQQVSDAWSNVTLASEVKATELLNAVAATFESKISSSLLGNSKERAAVISATYNVGGLGAMPKLQAALESDNRAEAWFEIRYNLNGGTSESQGIANRRYRESNLLGLYGDPATLTDDQKIAESKNVVRVLDEHAVKITQEETQYPPASNADLVVNQIRPSVDMLISKFGLGQTFDGKVL